MKIMICKYIGICAFILMFFESQAQIPIRDTAFANALYESFGESYPELLSDDKTILDTTMAKNISAYINPEKANSRGNIRFVDELVYFHSINGFAFQGHSIDTIPDLKHCKKIKTFSVQGNNLTYVTDLSLMPMLENVYLAKNKLDTIRGLENHPTLKTVFARINNLDYTIDIETIPNLELLTLSDNDLSWKHIYPYSKVAGFDTIIDIYSLKPIYEDKEVFLVEGDSFELVYDEDNGVPGLTYQVIKDSNIVLYQGTDNRFVIENVSLSDSGSYEIKCKIDIPEWSDLSIYTGKVNLSVYNCENMIENYAFTQESHYPQSKCRLENILFNGEVKNKEFNYFILNNNLEEEVKIDINEEFNLVAGEYDLKVTDGNGCESIIENALTIPSYQEISNVDYSIVSNCSELSFTLNNYLLTNTGSQFYFQLCNTERCFDIEDGIELSVANGVYNMFLLDGNNYEQIVLKELEIVKPFDCNEYFSPNNDGVNDEFYIGLEGNVQILDKGGKLILELDTPDYWDGKDMNGYDVPIGVYSILINGILQNLVSVIR